MTAGVPPVASRVPAKRRAGCPAGRLCRRQTGSGTPGEGARAGADAVTCGGGARIRPPGV
jgi:hypothetical protein